MSEVNRLARVEGYSDAVFAIASTLLVLEIRAPDLGPRATSGELWYALIQLWPSYLAFVISFGLIFIVWINHHNALHLLEKTSNAFLYANGFLLLTVTFVPFPTALLAKYVVTGLAPVVVMFYAGGSLLINIAINLWFFTMQKPVYLLKPEVSKQEIRKIWMQLGTGALVYLLAGIIALWHPWVGLGFFVGLAILWVAMSIANRGVDFK